MVRNDAPFYDLRRSRGSSGLEVTTLSVTGNLVDVFQVTPKIAALSKGLLAQRTGEGSLTSMLSEVVAKIAALLEDALAPCMPAFEVKFDALRDKVFDLDCLVPLLWDSLEGL